jgi:serine/threonine protein kinase
VSRRSFAGHTYEQRLHSGFYGDLYRANTAGDHEVRLLEVDADLSDMDGFSATLTTHGMQLARLEHANIVTTRSVGRAPEGRLIVITDSVAGQVTVEDLLNASAPGALPQSIAAGIGKELLQGLAAAHRAGMVHGAVHPRSVVIDGQGAVKLGDFAVGRALAVALSKETTSPLRDSLSSYLAPEVMRGKVATKTSDVYAAAAVVYVMLTGTLPPGTVGISAGFERMIQRALDPSLVRRYPDAVDFLENFVEALEDDLWPQASAEEIAAYAQGDDVKAPALPVRKSSDASLDDATEDVLSSLGLGLSAEAPARPAPRAPSGPVSRAPSGPVAAAGKADRASASALALDPPTDVDSRPAGHIAERDPISELIALSGDRPVSEGLPAPPLPPGMTRPPSAPAAKPSATQAEHAALAAIDALDVLDSEPGLPQTIHTQRAPSAPAPAARAASAPVERAASAPAQVLRAASAPVAHAASVWRTDDPRTMDTAEALAAAEALEPAVLAPAVLTPEVRRPLAPTPVAAAPVVPEYDPLVEVSLKKGGLGRVVWILFWLLIAAGGAGVLFWVVDHQNELKKQAEQEQARQRAENEAALAQLRSAQARAGQVVIDSSPDQAAVWMLLGRTPLESNPLSTAMLHELRLELEGHEPKDVRVEGSQWTGSGDAMKANVKVTLKSGNPDRAVPAAPPKPPASAFRGFRDGRGHIRVESEPAGAQVWLLVGFTPDVKVDGYAEVDYEFKVRRDGYLPGYITIAAKDWSASQEGNRISRSVELKRATKR